MRLKSNRLVETRVGSLGGHCEQEEDSIYVKVITMVAGRKMD